MKYIDEKKIKELLHAKNEPSTEEVDRILRKSMSLKRLTLEETAALLRVTDEKKVEKILESASKVKRDIYGNRVVLFAPLYISNICSNFCSYCAFRADNTGIARKKLNQEEIARQTAELLRTGHKRALLVSGEESNADVNYFVESIRTVYAQKYGKSSIRRININCAPLEIDGFKKIKAEGIGTYQIFQETYHDRTYREVHPRGPKSDPDKRLDAIDKAFKAGIDDVGIGVLYGLYDYRFETLALLMHVEYLENRFNVGPHTISVPRIEPAAGSDISENVPYKVSDEDFKKLVAILRLSVPYTGIILSTRETADLRDELFDLGVSQISAASKTSPGGYTEETGEKQFNLNDHRSLDEVIGALIEKKAIPSFCTACYRKERTGEKFMSLARPGTIKGKCGMNAIITLKEYLDDFASLKVKEDGYKFLDEMLEKLTPAEKEQVQVFFEDMKKGIRDEFV